MYAYMLTSDLDLEHCNLSFVSPLLLPSEFNLNLPKLALIGLQFITNVLQSASMDQQFRLMTEIVPFITLTKENFAEFRRQVYDYASSICLDNGFLTHRHGLLSFVVATAIWQNLPSRRRRAPKHHLSSTRHCYSARNFSRKCQCLTSF